MEQRTIPFTFDQYDSVTELQEVYRNLLAVAKDATQFAHAPYSKFRVGAAILLEDGKIVSGSNQENASYPVGICAERVTLSAASAAFPDKKITAMAITVQNEGGAINHPVSPCGLCRQTLLEYEERFKNPIVIILQGMAGPVYVIPSASLLLPIAFSNA